MLTPSLVEKARLHVRRFFLKHIGQRLPYHDLEHAMDVARTAVEIGRASGVAGGDLLLLEMAALFHDTGYAYRQEGHEEESARLASKWLTARGMEDRLVRKVCSMIMATHRDAVPRSLAQRVLRDADQAKAGQSDFMERGERLRLEREALLGHPIDAGEWLRNDLAYLEAHRFLTPYARRRFGRQKAKNIALLRQELGGGPARPVLPRDEQVANRDLSWLAFNARVLQEARDPSVPLLDRLKFVAIHGGNMDEFYRVRVAQLRALSHLGKWNRSALEVPADKLIKQINKEAQGQLAEVGALYTDMLVPGLRKQGIRFLKPGQLSQRQHQAVLELFHARVAPLLQPVDLHGEDAPFIRDGQLYLLMRLSRRNRAKERLVLMNVPSRKLGRFLVLPAAPGRTDLMYLDDAVRAGAATCFKGWHLESSHAVELSRDAELNLDEEFSDDLALKVRRSLHKRGKGNPARLLFDRKMPRPLVERVRCALGLKEADLLAGGRYHRLADLANLPVAGRPELKEPPMAPLGHPLLTKGDPFRQLDRRDALLHFPYDDFSAVVRLVERAAEDPAVKHIAITLYRVAERSRVCKALAMAARRGKRVDVLLEALARFDEGNNLRWGRVLAKAGARVSYGIAGYKVHCKLLLIERKQAGGVKRYACLGTGNFNEDTAGTYADMALCTARKAITAEVAGIMHDLMRNSPPGRTRQVITSPYQLRSFLEHAIDREIEQALQGRTASILLKLNSLEDRPLIRRLYQADRAGVQVRLIVRGICCLVPGKGNSIQAISIVDRFLEHARAYVFHHAGKPLVFLSSADWMQRNMDRRVEAMFPILDKRHRAEVMDHLELQWADNVKARVLGNGKGVGHPRQVGSGQRRIRSQTEWHGILAQFRKESRR
ncbi:MAG: polyphosphate kinase 1 [Flavobacteriales bacterium]|nr:polyphosphate kinase 1 [Flavobacteriales bacterium]